MCMCMCTWQGDIKTDLLAWRQITYQHLDPRDLATAIKQRLGTGKSKKHPHHVLPQLLLTVAHRTQLVHASLLDYP